MKQTRLYWIILTTCDNWHMYHVSLVHVFRQVLNFYLFTCAHYLQVATAETQSCEAAAAYNLEPLGIQKPLPDMELTPNPRDYQLLAVIGMGCGWTLNIQVIYITCSVY